MKTIALLDTVHPRFAEVLIQQGYQVEDFTSLAREEVLSKLDGVHALAIRSRFRIDKDFIDRMPSTLRVIGRYGSGMENIDVAYATEKGIRCVHAPEGNRQAVAEHALGMLLSVFNNLCKASAEVKFNQWKREENRGEELAGKTVGIIGYGNTGSAFARLLNAFPDLKVLVYDKYKTGFSHGNIVETNEYRIQEEADVVSLHIPLTSETYHLIDTRWIDRMHKPFYLINTSRGQCVDTHSLVEGLKSKKVLGACLDVLEYEKTSFEGLEMEHLPADFQYLVQHPKVMITPHIAGWSFQSHVKLAEILAQRIVDVLK
ncbi:NAD(P)-dependent oxidoreductase [Thermaurantimonas aggregans]|uniref:NAD(P)-dependent oxidoreductase n=1 Tax=Thermaurantimonas aggregans TaxID=2173829 RepID=UPI0023F1D060|nr:NAD(P)-dependent oxidoreductase [Thermaurantimonas aggregans]MCX8147723.1 hydroxyacid dehydrogenase [Thermaurantimonas aggregans]